MSIRSQRLRTLVSTLLLPFAGLAACDLALIDEHAPSAEDDFFPVPRVAAISDNHEHLFVASAARGSLKLISSNGNPTDEFLLSNTWQPVASATYYGPDFDAASINQSNEAGLVLHRNGTILPWFHHGGQLQFHWAGRLAAQSWVADGTVTFLDVDQSHDGTTYVLAEETPAGGLAHTVVAYRQADGTTGHIVVGDDKPVALAYDQHLDTVNVVFARTNVRDVMLKEYDEDLQLQRTRTIDDLREVSDLEVLAGWHYLGVLTCDNLACTQSTREFQLRDANLAIDDAIEVATVGVALDLPPFPLNGNSHVDVWRVGRDTWQLSEYEVVP